MRVLYVIGELTTGGAETALLRMVTGFSVITPAVVSLKSIEGSDIAAKMIAHGIPVYGLNLTRSLSAPLIILKLKSVIKSFRPDAIHGWMYHGNLLAAITAGQIPTLWGIRQSLYDLHSERIDSRAVIKLCARLSKRPAFIIYNSELAIAQHEAIGFSTRKRLFIPNGFDCDKFRPDKDAAADVRRELNIPPASVLIGLIARYHPMKNHTGFIRAAAMVAQRNQSAYFVLAGRDVNCDQTSLVNIIKEYGMQDRVFVLGKRHDIPRLNAALDIACSASSWGEGFSNAIGEAMACGVPCVATNIGESSNIVGETGIVVPPLCHESLASGIIHLLDSGRDARRAMGMAARSRIETLFPLSLAIRRHEEIYLNAL